MRYAEIDGGKVRYVLPAELSRDYTVLPPNAVEIDLDAKVSEGDIYVDGRFRKPTDDDRIATVLPGFRAERIRLFAETEWARYRHSDRLELGIDDALNWSEWLAYWQALRDLPEQPEFDPQSPAWPAMPE